MKTTTPISLFVSALLTILPRTNAAPDAQRANTSSTPIPMDQIGAAAGKQYQGDGLSVSATNSGALLRCVFQKLEGQVTQEGLWLTSTAEESQGERFRVVACEVGRVCPQPAVFGSPKACGALGQTRPTVSLLNGGTVEVNDKLARFIRPRLIEEYSVSVDGVRQDFIVLQRPSGDGLLRVELDVAGAKAEALVNGARLVLDGSGRRLNYNRLRATDANGKELAGRMVVETDSGVAASRQNAAVVGMEDGGALPNRPYTRLAVLVDDAAAVYPVRIDPTFSDADWISMGGIPGANGPVDAAVVDGAGNLYIGGAFTLVGDVFANRIAKWDGSSWTALGPGMTGMNDHVSALAVSGSDVYAAVGRDITSYITKWDGSTWTLLVSGINGPVLALAVLGSDVYAGGAFTTAGGAAVNRIAKWNGSSWSALGSGMSSGVSALAVSGTDLYAGGSFTNAGGVSANYVAKWDGNSWTALGSGMNDHVLALAVSGSDVYAGGAFTNADGSAANYIAKWNGSSWSALGSGMGGGGPFGTYVSALAISGSDVYAGGAFTNVGGSTANYIAKWDGSTWTALGSGMSYSVKTLAVSGSAVYAGGNFTVAGGVAASRVAKWDGSRWLTLGSGMGGAFPYVRALAVSSSDVYVGGDFTAAGGVAANYIAKWNGSTWTALGSGMGGGFPIRVWALAVSGSDVYVGGDFTVAGGSAANCIAKWNGSGWTALGSGMNNRVSALAVSGSDVYAGGLFTTAGGSAANYIAKWDGNSWTALGSGMNNYVRALAVSGNEVYAGGDFTTAGGSAANYIAKWDGNSWTTLASGIGGGDSIGTYVSVLAVLGTDLYVGGDFTMAGGSAAKYIAKWDGSSWMALGSGMNDQVYALAMTGSDVYAGGGFTMAGGGVANYIAKWDGSSWMALGSGMNNQVYALAVTGSNVYAGGPFTTAGGKVSVSIARANIGGSVPPTLSILRSGLNVIVSWPSPDTAGFALEQTSTLATPASWITNTTSVTDDGTNKSLAIPATDNQQFFRLRKP